MKKLFNDINNFVFKEIPSGFTELVKLIIKRETGSPTGNVNLLGGIILLIPWICMIFGDIPIKIINVVLSIFNRSLPEISETVVIMYIFLVFIFFYLSILTVGSVEKSKKRHQ